MSSQEQAPAAIRLRDLTRRFTARGAETLALDGVSLDVAPGEVYGIVGRSGAGKSTLIRCVKELLSAASVMFFFPFAVEMLGFSSRTLRGSPVVSVLVSESLLMFLLPCTSE